LCSVVVYFFSLDSYRREDSLKETYDGRMLKCGPKLVFMYLKCMYFLLLSGLNQRWVFGLN